MTGAQLAEAAYQGTLKGGIHHYALRIYFEDTDASGVVYHANYLRFMERARSDMLRCAGIEQRMALEASGRERGVYAVRTIQLEYLKPAFLDDALLVCSYVEEVGAATCHIRQKISRENVLLIDAKVTAAYLGDGGRPKRQPAEWRTQFQALAAAAQLYKEA